MSRVSVLALIPLAALVSGCVITDGETDGPYYPGGFTDGCRTAEAEQASFSTKYYRDKKLFEDEASYRSGWRSGYAQCRRMEDLSNRPGDLGEREPY